MSSSYRMELDKWLSQLDVKADRVLDVGGSQLPVRGRTRSWEVSEYKIADLPQPHADSPKPDFVLDLNQSSLDLLPKVKFDFIFCLEVFDYVYDPVGAMEKLSYFLDYNGQAWVTFPAFYPHHQPIEDDALRYMQAGIVKLADAVGFTIEEIIKRRPETDLLDQFFRAERMRAAKHFDHEITGWIVRFKK